MNKKEYQEIIKTTKELLKGLSPEDKIACAIILSAEIQRDTADIIAQQAFQVKEEIFKFLTEKSKT